MAERKSATITEIPKNEGSTSAGGSSWAALDLGLELLIGVDTENRKTTEHVVYEAKQKNAA